MKRLTTLDSTIGTGQARMTDDGCPHVPPRLPDQVEQYNLSSIPPWLAKTHFERLTEVIELRARWWAVCERMVNPGQANSDKRRAELLTTAKPSIS
jgi:hypothetical protein